MLVQSQQEEQKRCEICSTLTIKTPKDVVAVTTLQYQSTEKKQKTHKKKTKKLIAKDLVKKLRK